ncbi:Putative flippase GtrA (transmembrane translocase of bactoprenol-linked glucose) [Paramicrobacterium humi]|uniref:Putative flippase GtrA (Transmembrane translocase of bactoprenol-linked glucose) n=1 Tax=Paramicrobacterium humi TaxID=640635 RepID=A0A1H4JPH5_9MICO|nr:GtrA family protein [Microbacterium humi]SEB48210.1 Putative flippase GtrA (transmembrane translocase of bactoprenol-linked glucose) [Microbacterium humi]
MSLRSSALVSDASLFALVGGVGLLVDVGTFNLIAYSALRPAGSALVLTAKVIATLAAVTVNWIGNRYLTFRSRRRIDTLREAVEFATVSLAGGAIALWCLWLSHDVLRLTSPLADNVSANVVGLALGSAFRFALYRYWVFAAARTHGAPAVLPQADQTSARS